MASRESAEITSGSVKAMSAEHLGVLFPYSSVEG